MSRTLTLSNRHRGCRIDLRLFRRMLRALLEERIGLPEYDLGLCLLDEAAMTRLNETYLQHAGSTDVITFDYGPPQAAGADRAGLHGEIFLCADEAAIQADRYGTSLASELTRYAVHGVLHLLGYDDLRPDLRRVMKREENRRLRQLGEQFDLRQLTAPRSRRRGPPRTPRGSRH